MYIKTTFDMIVIIVGAFGLTAAPLAISFEPIAFAQTSPGSKAPPPPPPPTSSFHLRILCPVDPRICIKGFGTPIATSGNNVYIAWNNNDTGHWNVFFLKSSDGGKTFAKNIMLSAPNKGHVVDQNVQIAASGSNVYVTWWTNKTGLLMPVLRASNDNGNTFGKTMLLNSTG
jgi:hypothetical protein